MERCSKLVCEMANLSASALNDSIKMLEKYDSKTADLIRESEEKADHYEDILGTYLVKLSRHRVSDSDSATISKLLKAIGDYSERISDHSVNILESAEELKDKEIQFTSAARKTSSICSATQLPKSFRSPAMPSSITT